MFYELNALDINKEPVTMKAYEGNVLLIVNTASKCGFTPQYEDLQKLYDRYQRKGFEILGFPSNQFKEQEPGGAEEIKNFCKINYGVTFPLFDKVDVRGPKAHPIFMYLTEKAPFEGFDESNSMSRMLKSITENEYTLYLNDDTVKWNFTKFLIDRKGNVVKRYEPIVSPLDIEKDIESLL